jgi:hypothetical protein
MKALKNLILGTLVLAVSAIVALPVNVSAAANNGTLKVHEKSTVAASESNDPKVCNFNFEGFGFDQGQTGVIVITTQGGGNDKAEVKRVDMPAANANGYTETEYLTLSDGHYKTTLYGKSTNGSIDYKNDLKAKNKVIKVKCDTTTTPSNNGGQVNGDSTTTPSTDGKGGQLLAEAASTTKGQGEALPEVLPATGFNPLQAIFNTVAAGAGVYTSLMARRRA